jgi:drug/metabolite transporter (DMT)-like permease
MGSLRFVIAALALFCGLLLRKNDPRPDRADTVRLALGGLLGVTLYIGLQNVGVQMSTAADAALLVAATPAITMLIEMAARQTSLSWIRLAGVGVAMVGVYLLSHGGDEGLASNRLLGNILLVGCGVAWSLYNFTTQHVVQRYSMTTVISYQSIAGAILLLPLSLLEMGQWQTPAPEAWGVIIYLGIFCSVFAYLFYGFGLRRLTPGTATALLNLVPLFGLGVAVGWLQEAVTWREVIGGVIILVGVIISSNMVSPSASTEKALKENVKENVESGDETSIAIIEPEI